jgi:hypothetical protein
MLSSKRFCQNFARRKIPPRATMVVIPSPLFADCPLTYVHELAFEIIWINLAFKRAEYNKVLK